MTSSPAPRLARLLAPDHKAVAMRFLVTAMAMGVLGGTLAGLIRFQLAWPERALVPPETYLSLVTIHGTVMIFFVLSLGLLSGLGNLLIPLQIGARNMAFPRLNALSFWLILPSCALILGSFLVEGGPAAAGWTSYPPLSAIAAAVPGSAWGQTMWLGAMVLFIVSFHLTGINFVTTILGCRTRGMHLFRMPLLTWSYLVASVLALLSFPALAVAGLLLLLDRHAGTTFFIPGGLLVGGEITSGGGTPLLFQHLFWFLGHPEVYVIALPALGILFEVIPACARRPPFGYRTSVYAMCLVALLSLVVWGHHMYVSGMSAQLGEWFSIATLLITIPFTVLGVNLLASLWRGRIELRPQMLFALASISAIGTGGLGGIYLGSATSDVYFHDTHFVVGHFHFTIGLAAITALFAGVHHWFPKLFGRTMCDLPSRVHFWLTLIPFYVIFLLMHYQGMAGLLRRTYDPTAYDYAREAAGLNLPMTWFAFVLLAAQLLFVINFVWSARRGPRASPNPWHATTLEWTTDGVVPEHGNWSKEPPRVVHPPYLYDPAAPPSEGYTPQGATEGA